MLELISIAVALAGLASIIVGVKRAKDGVKNGSALAFLGVILLGLGVFNVLQAHGVIDLVGSSSH